MRLVLEVKELGETYERDMLITTQKAHFQALSSYIYTSFSMVIVTSYPIHRVVGL